MDEMKIGETVRWAVQRKIVTSGRGRWYKVTSNHATKNDAVKIMTLMKSYNMYSDDEFRIVRDVTVSYVETDVAEQPEEMEEVTSDCHD